MTPNASQSPPRMICYCYRGGDIHIGKRLPEAALPIATAPTRRALQKAVERRARLSYRGKPLVPGVPEANGMMEAIQAVSAFSKTIKALLLEKPSSSPAAV